MISLASHDPSKRRAWPAYSPPKARPKVSRPRPPHRWFGAELERLRIAYEDGADHVDVIAEAFNTSVGQVLRLAVRNKWKRRRSAEAIASMTALCRARRAA